MIAVRKLWRQQVSLYQNLVGLRASLYTLHANAVADMVSLTKPSLNFRLLQS
jgi:hypothetical protein